MLREKLISRLQRIDSPMFGLEFIYLTIIIFACIFGFIALVLLLVILFVSEPIMMIFITFILIIVLYWIRGIFKEIQKRQNKL
jgi:hypothetical protein